MSATRGSVAGVDDVERTLKARKRRLYRLGIVLAVVVIAVSWLARGPDDPLLTYGYPLVGVALAAFLPLLPRDDVPLVRVEIGLFLVAALLILVRLAWHLFLAESLEAQLLVLAGGHYWAFALLMIFGFLMFDRRLGLRMGVGLLATSLLLALAAVAVDAAEGTLTATPVTYLVRVHGFLALLLVLVAGVSSLREQLHRALERSEVLSSRAMTDPLTGLANRWAAEERLEAEIGDAARRRRGVGIALADVDGFKAINDTHGHGTGDEVLGAIAETLDAEVRARDLVARWGGEEFLLVMPETTPQEAAQIAERCRRAIADATPAGVAVTATFGVAGHREGESASALVRRADVALYHGKRTGRDRVEIAEPAVDAKGAAPGS